jgi:hypothetical protein
MCESASTCMSDQRWARQNIGGIEHDALFALLLFNVRADACQHNVSVAGICSLGLLLDFLLCAWYLEEQQLGLQGLQASFG